MMWISVWSALVLVVREATIILERWIIGWENTVTSRSTILV
jgi:hypothetical protein